MRYHERARSYASSWALLALLLAGFGVDLALGAGLVHVVGWAIAIVLVVGLDMVTVRAARRARSVVVTDDEVRVGEHALARARIASIGGEFDDGARVLGRALGEGLPKGTVGVAAQLDDGTVIVIPTRKPERLTEVLGAPAPVPEIRAADTEELAGLADLQQRALTLYEVGGFDPPPPGGNPRDAKVVYVAGRPPVGFIALGELDGMAHIEALSVLPARMRQGVGTALLDAACAWAKDQGYPAICAITMTDVPWSAPFFEARGFVEAQQRVGRRVVMRRELRQRVEDSV